MSGFGIKRPLCINKKPCCRKLYNMFPSRFEPVGTVDVKALVFCYATFYAEQNQLVRQC